MIKIQNQFGFLLLAAFSSFSQNSTYYKTGDTVYYNNNRATYLKTNTFVILKKVDSEKNLFEVEKYIFNEDLKEYRKASQFTSIGLQLLRANGTYVSFHENGEKASEGEVVNGQRSSGIWISYYDNGQKKSEEKLVDGSFFSDESRMQLINYWNKEGNQLVTNGNGRVAFTEDKLRFEGQYKRGFKTGNWLVYLNDAKKYEEQFKNGRLVKGTAFFDSVKTNYKNLKTPAYYKKKDGSALKKYFDRNLDSSDFGVYGDVSVSFTVTKDGLIKDTQMIKGLTPEFNSVFKEKLTKMENWTPATKRGNTVNSTYVLNLRFTR